MEPKTELFPLAPMFLPVPPLPPAPTVTVYEVPAVRPLSVAVR